MGKPMVMLLLAEASCNTPNSTPGWIHLRQLALQTLPGEALRVVRRPRRAHLKNWGENRILQWRNGLLRA
eukprot:7095659-Pyramimonas_sp.AAC.1